jgi:orotate phosphoribosyltransferase
MLSCTLSISCQETAVTSRFDPAIAELFAERRGHFVFESGHHGDLWLDLESLCLRPAALRSFTAELARWVKEQRTDVVCGPLVEGAFVALLVAEELGAEFVYTERLEPPANECDTNQVFQIQYRLPAVLRPTVRGRRVAIVNDVINAGSAVRGTAADLAECGAELVGIACLLTLGSAAADFARSSSTPLFHLATREMNLWPPHDCPLCQAGVATEN